MATKRKIARQTQKAGGPRFPSSPPAEGFVARVSFVYADRYFQVGDAVTHGDPILETHRDYFTAGTPVTAA